MGKYLDIARALRSRRMRESEEREDEKTPDVPADISAPADEGCEADPLGDGSDNEVLANHYPDKGDRDPGTEAIDAAEGAAPDRVGEIERYIRRNEDKYRTYIDPDDINARIPDGLIETSFFEGLGFSPTESEVFAAQLNIKRMDEREKVVPPSLEDAGVEHAMDALERLLNENPEYVTECDPEVLIDAVAALPTSFLVPTHEEMTIAMRINRLEPDTIDGPAPKRNRRTTSKKVQPSEIATTLRRIQRAPLREGRINEVQHWVRHRGKPRYYPEYEPITIRQVCSNLFWKRYFSFEPPEDEVEKELKEMVREVKRAEKRHKKRRKDLTSEGSRSPAANPGPSGQPEALFADHDDNHFDQDRIDQLREVLRQHPECLVQDPQDLIEQGVFNELEFEPSLAEVEEAQCQEHGV